MRQTLTIDEFKVRYARPGRLEWIGIRSQRRKPVTPLRTAELIRDRVRKGDHPFTRSNGRRQISLSRMPQQVLDHQQAQPMPLSRLSGKRKLRIALWAPDATHRDV